MLSGMELVPEISAPVIGLNKGVTIAIAIYCLSESAYFSTRKVRNWLPFKWHVCVCINLCRWCHIIGFHKHSIENYVKNMYQFCCFT